ncbi:hypothetical protein F5B20DRAFT_530332 [Whalleya microplaca]|nr:hypothetical protein F5B20DRAFT_530332 [Whalleya microplaca]
MRFSIRYWLLNGFVSRVYSMWWCYRAAWLCVVVDRGIIPLSNCKQSQYSVRPLDPYTPSISKLPGWAATAKV